MAKGSKKKSGDKLRALMRTQEINDLLSKSITESEALQNSGDDRPTYESHVIDLLARKESRVGSAGGSKSKPKKKRR